MSLIGHDRLGCPAARGRLMAAARVRGAPAVRRALAIASRCSDRERPAGPLALIERIRSSVIGDGTVLDGPFGRRRLAYADYTASGRALSFIEDFIRDQVLRSTETRAPRLLRPACRRRRCATRGGSFTGR
jgi:hypothetical protein